MPWKTIKNSNGTYKLINSKTGKVHAKASTKANVEKQLRLLQMIEGMKRK